MDRGLELGVLQWDRFAVVAEGRCAVLPGVTARRLALLVSVAPNARKVRVTCVSEPLGTWSLARQATQHKVVIPLQSYAGVRSGALKIQVVNSDKPVGIDGVYAAR